MSHYQDDTARVVDLFLKGIQGCISLRMVRGLFVNHALHFVKLNEDPILLRSCHHPNGASCKKTANYTSKFASRTPFSGSRSMDFKLSCRHQSQLLVDDTVWSHCVTGFGY